MNTYYGKKVKIGDMVLFSSDLFGIVISDYHSIMFCPGDGLGFELGNNNGWEKILKNPPRL